MTVMRQSNVPGTGLAAGGNFRKIVPRHSGLAFGALLGLWHLFWAGLVAAGFAQPFIDFMFRLHFIQPIYLVKPFELGTAALLILVTFITGFVLGCLFAVVWNNLTRAT